MLITDFLTNSHFLIQNCDIRKPQVFHYSCERYKAAGACFH